jgi:hypothetical protein
MYNESYCESDHAGIQSHQSINCIVIQRRVSHWKVCAVASESKLRLLLVRATGCQEARILECGNECPVYIGTS